MEETTLFECKYCNNSYSSNSNRKRHIKNIHKKYLETTIKHHIKCILCSVDQVTVMFSSYKDYNKHLEDAHEVIVQISSWFFTNKEEFDLWREKDKRDVNYAYRSETKLITSKLVYYNCNRTDSTAFQSTIQKNVMKTGGTIKIPGSCPSRMIVRFKENGRVVVQFFETHLGHEEEVRAQRLTKKEQTYIVEQLKAGVNKKRIIDNARNFNLPVSGLPGRLNLLNRKDISNLNRRYIVDTIKHKNDMIITAMKEEHSYSRKLINCEELEL